VSLDVVRKCFFGGSAAYGERVRRGPSLPFVKQLGGKIVCRPAMSYAKHPSFIQKNPRLKVAKKERGLRAVYKASWKFRAAK